MSKIAAQLESLRQRIADSNEPDTAPDYLERVAITPTDGVFHLDFYGDHAGDSIADLMQTLAQPTIAPYVRSIVLRGPDEGANGTRNWDLEPLLATDAMFSQLKVLSIQLNQPGDHNRSIVGEEFEEDGILARLLAKAPGIEELTAPSAPSAAFFEVGVRPIRLLSIDAGYDTQHFILNLAKSSCFPNLQCLQWGEYHETYIDDYLADCTPLDHYRELFGSNPFASVRSFHWRNPTCTDDEIRELKALTPALQLLVVHDSSRYV